MATVKETLRGELEKNRDTLEQYKETMEQYGQRLNNMLSMLSTLPQFQLASNFPPRTNTNPILPHQGNLPRSNGIHETDIQSTMDPEAQVRNFHPPTSNHTPKPRLEIPMFDRVKPRQWIRHCERFFQFYRVFEEQRVNLAATYLNDLVDFWYQGWIQDRGNDVNWTEFAEGLCEQFGERSMIDVIEEFNKLKQEGSVVEYQAKFKELRSIASTMQSD